MATECVLCHVENEIFYIIYLNVSLDGLSQPTDSTLKQNDPFLYLHTLCPQESVEYYMG